MSGAPPTIHEHRLGNGLQVLVWEERRAPVFAWQTWFGVGSRHEQPGRTGLAHLFEHLMFKATETRAEGEYDRILEERGADTNAATWVDWTYYKVRAPSDCVALVAELEADRMEHLRLDDDQLESEREVVVNERLLRVDNDPDGFLYERLYALAYDEHPYRWPTIGWMEDIRAISLEDCRDFYGRYYAPDNATIVVVGDVDTPRLLETIEARYSDIAPGGAADAQPADEAPLGAARREEHALPLSSERGIFAWRAPRAGDPDLPALEILDEVLTGGESARAWLDLVLDRELCTGLGGWVPDWRFPGLYEIGLTMRPGHRVEEAEVVLEGLLARMCDEPITERELTKARNSLEADHLRGSASSSARARGLGHAHIVRGDHREWLRQAEAWHAVTAEDVQRAAQRVLRPEGRVLMIGRPQAATS